MGRTGVGLREQYAPPSIELGFLSQKNRRGCFPSPPTLLHFKRNPPISPKISRSAATMRRGGGGAGGSRRLPKSSLAPSTASEATPVVDPVIRNLTNAFNRRDSDAASHCSSRPPSSHGVGISSTHHDRSTQATALRDVNAFLGHAVTLRAPLPAARDILNAFRYFLNHFGFHLQEKESTLEDDILLFLRMMSCPHKLARSALKAPGTPHFWPPLLSVLHWLTLLATTCGDGTDSSSFCDLMLYTTKGYSHFIMGDDEAAEALDDEYVNKARTHAEAAVEATRALEKEAEEWEEKRNQLTSGPSRLEALEADKVALAEDVHKFESVVKTWSAKVTEREQALMNLRKEEEVKLMDAQHLAAENQELLKKVQAQAVNVRDVDRMHRDKQVVENDISKLENGNATLEEKGWELEAALVTKLEELETIAEQCNQALKRYESGA